MDGADRKGVNGKIKKNAHLKIACVAGLLTLLFFFALVFGAGIMSKAGFRSKTGERAADFYQTLRLFDDVMAVSERSGYLNHDHVKNLLDALDKLAAGAEARLSILKRYRNLAKRYPEYIEGYRYSVDFAAVKFPHSALIAALAAEADMSPEKLRKTAQTLSANGPLSDISFLPVAFCMYALSGDFQNITSAAAINRAGDLYTAFTGSLRDTEGDIERIREEMLVDAALIKIADGKYEEAAAALARLDPKNVSSPKSLDFIAHYSYDFANPLLAAELWARLGGEKNLALAASALYAAGEIDKARALWLLLAKDTAVKTESTAAIMPKILYNLALTANTEAEKIYFLENLLAETKDVETNREGLIASLIMYTRLLPENRALDILSGHPLAGQEPLLDLEYLRRNTETMPLNRSIAETWLLLNRHPKAHELYRWTSWYFEYQRQYGELEALQRFAAQNHVESPYLAFHKALGVLRDGKTSEAAALLENVTGIPLWLRYANMALLFDARHEYAPALRYYEDAAAAVPYEKNAALRSGAAKIYLKMARCRRVLGAKPEETRRDLERAYSLDSENINIRLALRKQ